MDEYAKELFKEAKGISNGHPVDEAELKRLQHYLPEAADKLIQVGALYPTRTGYEVGGLRENCRCNKKSQGR